MKDGTETKDLAALFARQTNYDLLTIRDLLKEPTTPRESDGRARPETVSARLNDLSSLGDLQIPSLPTTPLADLEIQFQGVKITELFRSLMGMVQSPDEVVGRVTERKGQVDVQVEFRRALEADSTPLPPQETRDHASLEDASFATACRILYLLGSSKDPTLLNIYSPEELQIYLRSLRQFGLYKAYRDEARDDPTSKRQTALDKSDELLKALIERKTNIDPAYKLGYVVALEKGDVLRAKGLLDEYVKRRNAPANPRGPDTSAEKLQRVLTPAATAAFNPRSPQAKIQPGLSVSSSAQPTHFGTVCCIVRDANGITYLLSSDHVLGLAGADVIVPSPLDGGKDAVAKVERSAHLAGAAGSIARLLPNMPFDPSCPVIGKFSGIGTITLGDKIRMVGRRSVVAHGTVTGVEVTVAMQYNDPFRGLVSCVGEAGHEFSDLGDSGAPVVNDKNELVGMLYAKSSDGVSLFIPIQPILKALQVELVR